MSPLETAIFIFTLSMTTLSFTILAWMREREIHKARHRDNHT